LFGQNWANQLDLGVIYPLDKVRTALKSIYRYNWAPDVAAQNKAHPPQRWFARPGEAGLFVCTWPKGGELSLPFVYSNEVWTGIEYHVASHLMRMGMIKEGLEIVRICRARYDGRTRNPFDEYECGHWYARAMSSYALLQALTGARYDAVEKVLYLEPRIAGDFRGFLSTASGYGAVSTSGRRSPASGSSRSGSTRRFAACSRLSSYSR